ncbi:MAG: hypothetical protein IJP90_07850 [Treponema sp.]|nr:hypothetical protein [Treponema sp.]MBR0099616.1 hypothetical protein [Treponema sp.]
MGQVIRTVGKFKIGGAEFDVELNRSPARKNERDIHIQNEKFRLEIPENNFISMLTCVLLAKKQFDILKGESHE